MSQNLEQTTTPDGLVRIGDTVIDTDGKAWTVVRIREGENGDPDMIKATVTLETWIPADSARTMRSIGEVDQ